jgi:hypothetical protein
MYTATSALDKSSLALLPMSSVSVPENSATAVACHLELCEGRVFFWPVIYNLQPSPGISSENFLQLGELLPPRRNGVCSAETKGLRPKTETRDIGVTRQTCASAVSTDIRQFKVSLIEADKDIDPVVSSIVCRNLKTPLGATVAHNA